MKALILVLLLMAVPRAAETTKPMHIYNYLALGDSYTIGEALPFHQNFPSQVVQLLRNRGYSFSAPEVLAKTGWTTDELTAAMKTQRFLPRYDFVTLLIGVNNQYRGLDVIPFKEELEALVNRAIALAGDRKERVILITIPNYGLTPFAASLDRGKIAHELEVFNSVIRALSLQYKTGLVDITPDFESAGTDATLIASDGLHPSETAYERWAQRVAAAISAQLK